MIIESAASLAEWLSVYNTKEIEQDPIDIENFKTSVAVLSVSRKRKERSGKFTKEAKDARFMDEGGICQACCRQIIGEWHAHHIIPRCVGGDSSPENLMVLHPECHIGDGYFEALHPGISLNTKKLFSKKRLNG